MKNRNANSKYIRFYNLLNTAFYPTMGTWVRAEARFNVPNDANLNESLTYALKRSEVYREDSIQGYVRINLCAVHIIPAGKVLAVQLIAQVGLKQ